MIFDERTIYLHCTVKAGGKELYKDFDMGEAWKAMLEATNDYDVVELLVRSMNYNEARRIQKNARTTHV